MDFLSNLPDHNHVLIADSYYGSPNLGKLLDRFGFGFILICQKNRFFKELHEEDVKFEKYGVLSMVNHGICGSIFKDKSRKVNVLQNIFEIQKKLFNSGSFKPEFIRYYNEHHGHVDKADSYIHGFWFPHKVIKWTFCCIIGFLQICVVNSYTYFKEVNQNEIKFEDYVVQLSKELINYQSNEIIDIPQSGCNKPNKKHWLIDNYFEKRVECISCKKRVHQTKRVSQVMTACTGCNWNAVCKKCYDFFCKDK